MKYIVLLCDGMADIPVDALGGGTPMSVADKKTMNMLASKAEVGMVKTVPDGMKPGSDVANLSVMGYDPAKYYTGRSPLEAMSIGIELLSTDVTMRCNLVTLSDDRCYNKKTLIDYCADDISTEEAQVLIEAVQKEIGNSEFEFYTGIAYRHCLVWHNGDPTPGILTPPHDITGKKITEYIPSGKNVDKLYDMMKKSHKILKDHPINIERIKNGKLPANSIWLWGEGTAPALCSFEEKFGLKGAVISAVDLLKGIGICAKMTSVDVDGATGYIDTNFKGKLEASIDQLKSDKDFVYIHLEAPDECGHRGETENKVKAIELIDKLVLSPLIEELKKMGDYSILICPDHPTPLAIRTHSSESVPYLIYRSNDEKNSGITNFNEETAKSTGILVDPGHKLMERFLS